MFLKNGPEGLYPFAGVNGLLQAQGETLSPGMLGRYTETRQEIESIVRQQARDQ